ncbi:MAG: NAD(P)-dependent oxidoreductase [Spirochaetaceae bacterium]|nr:NAD(P)-dependent oxidoreductase [Spirochaetaceae bacterium]
MMDEIKKMDKDMKIGWIGTGVMGFWMCHHLIKAGYKTHIYNRTKEKANSLIDMGAQWSDSPAEVAANSDIVFSIVGYPKDVEEIYFGENGILKGCSSNREASGKSKYLVDMTTTKPSLSIEIYNKAKEIGCYALDAPVSGGDVGAREAGLTIMVGGDKNIYDFLMPVFSHIGKNIKYAGKAGSGQNTKMCNQIAITGVIIGMCESLLYGYKAGLNLEEMVNTIKTGAAGSWALENYAPRIFKEDYAPGFIVEHFIKDMEIALEESRKMGLNLPGLVLVNQLYVVLKAMGYGKSGTHSLMFALNRLSNSNFPQPEPMVK